MANRRRQPRMYDQAMMNALKGVPLPDKIKCGRCHKFKSQKHYSNKQLTDARLTVRNGGPNARFNINCQPCTGVEVVEIECSMCHKTKGLEEFAKSQRKRPDSAKCFACIDDQLDQGAVQDDIYESDDRSKAFGAGDSSYAYGTWPTVWDDSTATEPSEVDEEWHDDRNDDGEAGGLTVSKDFARKLSMSSTGQDTLIEFQYDRSSEVNDNVWQKVGPTKSWHTKSANAPSTSSGFDPNKYGKPPTRSTCGSVSGSVHTFSSGFTERSDITEYKNGWAKIKAYDPKKDRDPPPPKPVQDDWSSESEQEEDDDDDRDDDTEI